MPLRTDLAEPVALQTHDLPWDPYSAFWRLSPMILLVALLLSALMGVFGGLLPARRAARMRVIEALRRA